MRNRVNRLFRSIAASGKDVDCVAIASSIPEPNFMWLAGLSAGLFEESLLIASSDGLHAIVPRLELSAVPKGIEVQCFSSMQEKTELAQKLLKNRVIGFDEKKISHSNYLILKRCCNKLQGVSDELAYARAVKEPSEVVRIAAAAKLTRNSISLALNGLRENVLESSVATEIAAAFAKRGASQAFDSICAFGRNSSVPHRRTASARLKKGQLVLVDAGAKLSGYCGDITRTRVFGARPSFTQQAMLDTVADAQRIAFAAIKPGVRASDVHNAVSNYIDSQGFKGCFVHSTGHALGLEVHDGLRVSSKSNFAFEKGMVFTVEPGVYVPKIGGVRIEDDIVVTANGCKLL
ncbi:hypothetical protein AUJ65_06565 [Candidatus Micrarchaeota archaeon CG1_02_51_15]|nr:MAG: hypothetical protein AUJ65_06565 [Candidatus Micrarchaeota archaeon CG1_02_51_15]